MYRPILPFLISYKNGIPLKYFGLVDSGADKSYMGVEFTSILGIKNLEKGKMEQVAGVNGVSAAYFHPVALNIGGHRFSTEIGFVTDSNLTSSGYALLGQMGLFDHFDVRFSFKKLEMELTYIGVIKK